MKSITATAKLVGIALLVGAAMLGSASAQTQIERGGDISELTIEQQNGVTFQDSSGSPMSEPLKACRKYGWSLARIRLYVNPPVPNGVYIQDLPYVVSLAKRAKAQNMKLLLDLHYTDANQTNYHDLPAAWMGQTYAQLQSTVQNYTANVMNTMKANGVTPEYVQIGNEIGDGCFNPVGGPITFQNGVPSDPTVWSQFIGLIKSGVAGVRAVSPTTQIMIHIPGGAWSGWCTEFFDNFNAAGVDYNLIGVSFYPSMITQGVTATDLSAIKATLDALHNRYPGKKLWVAETSYMWNWGTTSGTGVYWNDPNGQYWYTHDLCNLVASYSDGGGVCYWGVYYVANEKLGTDSWAGQALFDSTWYTPDGGITWRTNSYHKMLRAFGAL